MLMPKFFARQLAQPSGVLGRLVMGPLLNLMNADPNQLVLDALALTPADRVLEAGFGGGALLKWISLLVPNGAAVGVELSDAMIASAKRRLRRECASGLVELRQGTVESIPCPEKSFDGACSVNTVYFWKDIDVALKEFHRVIRPGGRLVLDFESEEKMQDMMLDKRGFLLRTPEELSSALVACGFSSGELTSFTSRVTDSFALTVERC